MANSYIYDAHGLKMVTKHYVAVMDILYLAGVNRFTAKKIKMCPIHNNIICSEKKIDQKPYIPAAMKLILA